MATALSIVVLSRFSQGMEELKGLLNGQILWVQLSEIALVAVMYGLLTLFHWCFRQRFYRLSFHESGTAAVGYLWEFLFFASFAVVITLVVNLAGVLLVFSFLIIPAISASLLSQSIRSQLLIGWLLGGCVSAVGLYLSFVGDLPTGAMVVAVMGCLPMVALVVKYSFKRAG